MTVMTASQVWIVILNWNGLRDTLVCLESVLASDYQDYRVVLVDNGSTDGSVEAIRSWAASRAPALTCVQYEAATAVSGGRARDEALLSKAPPGAALVLITIGRNLGYAGGNNVGIRYAERCGAEYVWLLNNDTVVDSAALSEMVSLLAHEDRAAVCGARILAYDRPGVLLAAGGGWFNPWRGLTYHYGARETDSQEWDYVFEPQYVTGACLLVRTAAIARAGLMREGFFLYGEELEWQMRFRRAGWGALYCPSARVRHKENATTGWKSRTVEYYYTRNLLWITRRCAPWGLPSAVLVHLLRALRRSVAGQFGRAAAVVRGIRDGLGRDESGVRGCE